MTQFEHFESNNIDFEQHNGAGLARLYEGAENLLGDRTAVAADIIDDYSRNVRLTADVHEEVIELASMSSDSESTTEIRYRLDRQNDAPRLARLQENEWFSVDLKEPETAVYIQDAHKIVIRLTYADGHKG